MIVTDDRVARFVGRGVSQIIYPPFTAMGIDRGGEIVAGVVFNSYTGHNIHVTVAGRGWTREFLRGVGEYAFNQLGCARITAITEQPAVIGFAKRLGGVVEGVMRDMFGPGRDGTLIGVTKEDYRF